MNSINIFFKKIENEDEIESQSLLNKEIKKENKNV